jgi:hypothetical protein
MISVGDLVSVETKWHGKKSGIIIEKIEDSYGVSWLIMPSDHPRQIISCTQDIDVVQHA